MDEGRVEEWAQGTVLWKGTLVLSVIVLTLHSKLPSSSLTSEPHTNLNFRYPVRVGGVQLCVFDCPLVFHQVWMANQPLHFAFRGSTPDP